MGIEVRVEHVHTRLLAYGITVSIFSSDEVEESLTVVAEPLRRRADLYVS